MPACNHSRSRSIAISARRTTTGPVETHRGGRKLACTRLRPSSIITYSVLYNGHILTIIDGTDETLDIHNTQYAMWVKASIRNTQYANPVKPHCVIRKMLPHDTQLLNTLSMAYLVGKSKVG